MYFVDASHFVLASFLGWVWCFVRLYVRAASGRQRYNVLGALNAVTHELVTEINTTYITVLSLLGQTAVSAMVAYSFARLRWPLRDFWFLVMLATMMVPPQVTLIPLYIMWKNVGGLDTYWLVTSDRELRERAGGRAERVIGGGAFARILRDTLRE